MSTTYELETRLTRALEQIEDHWDALLPVTIPAIVNGMGKSPRRVVASKYDDPNDADLSLADRRVGLRHDVMMQLNSWARIVMEDADVAHGLPAGNDVPGLCTFLKRWARWLSGHEAGEVAADELATVANQVRSTAAPRGKDWLSIGTCPREVITDTSERVVCGHTVRAYASKLSLEDIARDDLHFITCPGCGHEDTMAWWVSQIVPEGANLAPADSVIAFVSVRTSEALTHQQLRQWASRGFIQRHGRDVGGRMLYSARAVLAYAEGKVVEGREEEAS